MGGRGGGFFDYWGKAGECDQAEPYHLLAFHCLDVAAVGEELLLQGPGLLSKLEGLAGIGAESLRRFLPFLLALHDLGKFAEPFQDQRSELVEKLQGKRQVLPYRTRHDTLGYLLWRAWAGRRCDPREAGLVEELLPIVAAGEAVARSDLDYVLQSWMAAVLGHHGRPPEDGQLGPDTFQAHPALPLARSRADAAAFARAVAQILAPGVLESQLDVDDLHERASRSSWWLAGFTILCDWLGSNKDCFPFRSAPSPLADYWTLARAAAREAVKRSGLFASVPRPYRQIGDLFPKIASQPSPLQEAAADVALGDGAQLFFLEDLTGSGKTEAALVLAHRLMSDGKADGLYFALPTMATANAMDSRVRPLLAQLFEGHPSYVLAHSGPRLTVEDRLAIAGKPVEGRGRDQDEEASRAAAGWLADSRKKALLATLGVGTIDQALLAALQSRHAALRLFGLHRHVLVADEVHACDTYMLEVLCALLELHAALGGSAILLSATLPAAQRERLAAAFSRGLRDRGRSTLGSEAYPLLTAVGRGRALELPVAPRRDVPRTVGIAWHTSVESAATAVIAAAQAGRCACWIRNSVADALEACDALAGVLGRESVTLFHARFALGDRLRIEQEVLERFGKDGAAAARAGRVVVATQVVEQSLDLDFDVMVTDVCPIDLIIQRAGRLQRHGERFPGRQPPVLEILAPEWSDDPPASWLARPFARTARVYEDPGLLWRTVRELRRQAKLAMPEEARTLVEAVYGCDDVPESLRPRSNAAMGESLSHASVARNAVLSLSQGYLRAGADWSSEARTPTRLGEPTTTVRLARVEGAEARAWRSDLSPRLQWPLSQVSVARRLVAKPAAVDEALRLEAERTQPFVGDDVVTVVLRQGEDGVWWGSAVAERGTGERRLEVPVRISYTADRGLGVREEK